MKVTINISGAGSSVGAGEYSTGTSVSILGVPATGNVFKYFIIDGAQIITNPYIFTAGDSDVIVSCVFYTPFEQYIQGATSFDIPDLTLNNIRLTRGVTLGQDTAELSKKTLELSLADALMYGASRPSSVGGSKDSDGGWSHTDGSVTISNSDRIFLRTRALDIYKSYGENSGSTGITLTNLNGVAYRR